MNDPLTCAKLRSLVTHQALFARSRVVIRLADGTPLRLVSDEVTAPTVVDEATGQLKLAGEPILILTVDRVYP